MRDAETSIYSEFQELQDSGKSSNAFIEKISKQPEYMFTLPAYGNYRYNFVIGLVNQSIKQSIKHVENLQGWVLVTSISRYQDWKDKINKFVWRSEKQAEAAHNGTQQYVPNCLHITYDSLGLLKHYKKADKSIIIYDDAHLLNLHIKYNRDIKLIKKLREFGKPIMLSTQIVLDDIGLLHYIANKGTKTYENAVEIQKNYRKRMNNAAYFAQLMANASKDLRVFVFGTILLGLLRKFTSTVSSATEDGLAPHYGYRRTQKYRGGGYQTHKRRGGMEAFTAIAASAHMPIFIFNIVIFFLVCLLIRGYNAFARITHVLPVFTLTYILEFVYNTIKSMLVDMPSKSGQWVKHREREVKRFARNFFRYLNRNINTLTRVKSKYELVQQAQRAMHNMSRQAAPLLKLSTSEFKWIMGVLLLSGLVWLASGATSLVATSLGDYSDEFYNKYVIGKIYTYPLRKFADGQFTRTHFEGKMHTVYVYGKPTQTVPPPRPSRALPTDEDEIYTSKIEKCIEKIGNRENVVIYTKRDKVEKVEDEVKKKKEKVTNKDINILCFEDLCNEKETENETMISIKKCTEIHYLDPPTYDTDERLIAYLTDSSSKQTRHILNLNLYVTSLEIKRHDFSKRIKRYEYVHKPNRTNMFYSLFTQKSTNIMAETQKNRSEVERDMKKIYEKVPPKEIDSIRDMPQPTPLTKDTIKALNEFYRKRQTNVAEALNILSEERKSLDDIMPGEFDRYNEEDIQDLMKKRADNKFAQAEIDYKLDLYNRLAMKKAD